ncbi:MAG: hypothetical protein KAS94_04955 [Desulfobulbaceae bacterium]|nr:hypothetical protein [Desulfobulbaceae bacterium]
MLFLVAGAILILTGGLVSVLFWVPGLVDRQKLKEMLGVRYPLVYLVYSANGPVLLVAGILLVMKHFGVF